MPKSWKKLEKNEHLKNFYSFWKVFLELEEFDHFPPLIPASSPPGMFLGGSHA